MTTYALHTREGDKLVPLEKVEAGSPEDAGTRYSRQKNEGGTPPAEETFVVIVDSAITEVTVRAKTNVTFEVTSDREVRRRAQEAKDTPAAKSQEAHDAAGDPSNDVPQRDAVNA